MHNTWEEIPQNQKINLTTDDTIIAGLQVFDERVTKKKTIKLEIIVFGSNHKNDKEISSGFG